MELLHLIFSSKISKQIVIEIIDSQTLKYEGDRLIATSWTKTLDFEIIDKGTLKLGEDIFCYNAAE